MATVAIPAAKWNWVPPYPQSRTANNLDADYQLVERCLAGHDAAWEDLVKLHTRRVYSICYRFTNSDAEAQDLTQDVFLRVFKNLKSFRAGEGLFVVWLTRLTRNLLIDHFGRDHGGAGQDGWNAGRERSE
jgi:RNA polymerase sigma-70 factor (ECF subfamily)